MAPPVSAATAMLRQLEEDDDDVVPPPTPPPMSGSATPRLDANEERTRGKKSLLGRQQQAVVIAAAAAFAQSNNSSATAATSAAAADQQQQLSPPEGSDSPLPQGSVSASLRVANPPSVSASGINSGRSGQSLTSPFSMTPQTFGAVPALPSSARTPTGSRAHTPRGSIHNGGGATPHELSMTGCAPVLDAHSANVSPARVAGDSNSELIGGQLEEGAVDLAGSGRPAMLGSALNSGSMAGSAPSSARLSVRTGASARVSPKNVSNDASVSSARRTSAVVNGRLAVPGAAVAPIPSPLGGSTATPNAASAFTSSPAVAAAPPAREVPIGSNGKPKLTKAEKEAKRARKAEIRAERDRRKSEHPPPAAGEGETSMRSQTAAADRTSLSSAPTLTSPVDSAVAVGSKRGSPMDDDDAAGVPMAADHAGDQEGLTAEESQPAALANIDGALGPEEGNAGGDTAVELLDANTTSVGDYGPRSARAALAAEKAELMADSALLYHTRQQTAAEAEASTRHRIEVQSLAAPGGSGSYTSHQQGGLAVPGQGQGQGGTSNGGGATLYKASPHSPTPFDATTPQKEGGPAELSGPTEQSPSSLFAESRNGMVGLLTPDRGDGRPAQGVVRRSHVSQHSRLPSHTGDGPEDVDAALVGDGDGAAPVEAVRRPLPGGVDDSGFMSHSDDGLSFPLLAMAKDAIAEEERRTKELLAPRAAASPTPSDGNVSGAGRQSKPASANRTPYAMEPVKKFSDFCVDEIDLDATVPRLKPKDPDDSSEKERKESKANSAKSKTDISASLRSSTDDKASVVSGQAAANTGGGLASSVCSGDRVVASRPGSGAVSASVTPRDPQLEQKKRQHANTAAAMGMAPKAQRTSRGGPEFKFNKQARGVGGGGLFHRDKERLATQRQLQGHGARSSTPDVTSQVRANLAMGDDLLGDTLRSESGMARPGTSGGRSSSVGAGGVGGGGGTAHFRRATDFNRAAHLNPAILAMPTVDESKMRIAPLLNRTKHLGQVYDFHMEAATQQVCDHATFRVLLEKEEEIAKAKGKSVSWQVQPKSSAADKRDGSAGRDDSVPRPKSQGQMLDEVGLDPHLKAARSSARLVLSAMFKPPTEPRLRIGGGPRTPEKTSATTTTAKKTASSQRPSSASRHRPKAAVAAATVDHNDDDLQAFDDEAAAVSDHGAPIAAAEQLPGDTSGGLPGALSASHFAQSDVSLTQQFLAVPSGKPKGKKPSRGSSPARGGAKSPGAGSRSPSARDRSPSPAPADQMPGGKPPLATRSPSNASVLSAASAASGAAGVGGTESRQGHRGSRASDKAAALYAAIHGAAGDVAVPAEIRRETELDELRRLITTPAVTKISASAISNAELSASLAVARKVPTPTPQQIAGSAGAGIETQQDREVEDAFRRSLLHRSTGDDAWKHNKVFEAGKSYAKALQLELVLNSRGDDFVDINVRLGDVFVALDSPDDAVPLYLKAADVSTVSLKATGRLKKARVLAHAGRVMLEAGFPHLAQPFLSDAVAVMERDMPQSVEHAEALRMLVQSAMTIAAPDDETATTSAIVALQEALAILDVVSPQSLEAARVLRDLAELTLTRRHDPDDALELAAKAQQIVERASKNGTYDTARILEVQGDCNTERCQPHIALGQYERACRLMDAAFPSHPDFILLTAKAMTASAESKKIGSAKAYFKNALTVDGKYKHLYYARGLSLMSKGEVENAYGAFYNAIECDPSYFDAIIGRLELVRTMMNEGHDAVAKCDFPTEVSRARELLEMSKYDSWKITELRKQSRVCRFPGTVRMPPNRCRSVDDYHAALQELLDAFETETKTLIAERAIRRKTAKKEPVVRSRKQSLVNPVTTNEDHGFPLTRYLRPSDFNPDCMLDNPTVLLEDMDRAVARPMCDILKEAGIDVEAGLHDDDQRSQRFGRAGGEDQSQSEGGHGQTLSVPGGGGALGGALGGGGSRAGSRRASAAGHRGAINAFADGSRQATPTNRRRSTAGMLSGLGGEGDLSAAHAPGVQNVGSISLMLPADLPASAAAADAAALDQRGSEGGAQHRSDATADDAQVPAIDAGFVAFGEDADGAPFSPNPEHPGDGGIRRGSTSMTGPGASGVGSALNSARAATARRRSSLLPTVGPPRGGGGTPASASTTSVIIGTERRRSTAVFADVTDDTAVDARRTSVMIGPDGLPSAFANTDGAASRRRSRDPTGRRSSTQVVVQRKEDGSVALSEQDKVMNLTVDGIKNLREPPPFTVKGAELQPLREAGLRFLEPDTPAASKLFFTALVSELRAVFFAHLVLVSESAAAAPGAAGLGSHAITTTAADTMDPSGKMYRDFVKFLITGTDTCAQYTSQYLNAGLTHVVVQGAKMRTGPGAAQLRKTFANEAWRDDVCASVKITSRTALLRLRQLNLNRFNFGAVAVRLGLAIIEQVQQGQLLPADDIYTGCPFGKERHNLAQDMGQSVEVAGKSVDEARRRHLKYFFERCPTPVEAAARAHAWAFVSRVTSADNSVAVAAFEVSNRHHKANQRAAERAKKAGKKGSKSSAHSSPNFADLGEDSPGGTPGAVTPRGVGGGGADYDVRQPFSEGLPVVSVLFGEDARSARQEERTHGGAGGKSGSAAGVSGPRKVDSDALRSDGESLNQCCVIA